MNTKQQQLLFDKGITNVPSDALCSDNTLAESVGMVYEDGEHRVIQEPVEVISSAVTNANVSMDIPTILYIHTFNDESRYIGYYYTGAIYVLTWGVVENKVFKQKAVLVNPDHTPFQWTNSTKVTSVGKTLVVTDTSGIHYFLWQTGSADFYKSIGNIPEPNINIWLSVDSTHNYDTVETSGNSSEIIHWQIDGSGEVEIEENQQEAYNDLVVGLYAKNKKNIAGENGFCEPFFVRYALEMYDGSYCFISNPILLFPTIKKNSYAKLKLRHALPETFEQLGFTLVTRYSKLFCSQGTDYTNYSDVVKDVVLFVTDGIRIYNTESDQENTHINDTTTVLTDGICSSDNAITETTGSSSDLFPDRTGLYNLYDVLKKRKEDYIIEDIKARSVFYKLCSLGLKSFTSVDVSSKIQENVLENITTQEYLEYDDYYSRCELYPSYIYSYNSRLNLASVKRGFFEGYGFFMPWDNAQSASYNIFVTIKTDIGDVVVKHSVTTKQKMGYYFYYPDSRATNVVIIDATNNNTKLLDTKLISHSGLNGAYYFAGLPASTPPSRDTTASGSTTVSTSPKEVLSNYIVQSEVNNPWVYQAQGYFAVGTGKIKGMSSITQALSEGQFGSFPLLVFSDSGIWALSVADTGYYNSVHPMSREVCNNDKSITQTDGAVFFTSDKGLMVVVGSQVKCVSEQLSGRTDPFVAATYPDSEPTFNHTTMGNIKSFFKNCHIAYDYRDSLLWIFSNSGAANYCYIYSIKSGAFAKYKLSSPSLTCVNSYPDYFIQIVGNSNKLYSFLNRPDINYDYSSGSNFKQYSATMLTRPMKFENALALKSIMQMKHITQFSPYNITTSSVVNGETVTTTTPYKAAITFRLFASNNLESWVELSSLRGTPWKYFRFRLDFANLIATDRYAGTMLITQERRTDKLR